MDLPELTHAELLRRIQLEIDRIGSQADVARMWGVSGQMISAILKGERNIGPKLLKALKLKRVTLIVHRYAPAKRDTPRRQVVRKPARLTERIDPK